MTLQTGQQVVCIDVSDHGRGLPTPALVLDRVYTIAETIEAPDIIEADGSLTKGGFGVRLVEITGQWFRACRFRPAVTRKYDISIFQKALDDTLRAPALAATVRSEE